MKNLIFIFCLILGINAFAGQSGVFMVVKGNVSIQRLDGKVEKAKLNSILYPGETVTSEADSKAKIVMTDRNIINVLPNTKIVIEKYTNEPADKTVNIKLESGKIRTDVEQKYDGKDSKFEIRTTVAAMGVRGTQLVVSHNANTDTTEVVTLTGEVYVLRANKLSSALGFGSKGELVVKAQEMLRLKSDSKSAKIERMNLKAFEALKNETFVSVETEKPAGGVRN